MRAGRERERRARGHEHREVVELVPKGGGEVLVLVLPLLDEVVRLLSGVGVAGGGLRQDLGADADGGGVGCRRDGLERERDGGGCGAVLLDARPDLEERRRRTDGLVCVAHLGARVPPRKVGGPLARN